MRKDAFYTRIEAELYLMRIYAIETKENQKAFIISDHLHKTFPNNPYFHRFYARMLYSTGKMTELKQASEEILARIDAGKMGYEEISGRYAAYYLAYWYDSPRRDQNKALEYYERSIEFSEKIEAFGSGYYHISLSRLAEKAAKDKDYELAMSYYDKILQHADKKMSYYKTAKKFKKDYKKKYRKGKS